MTVAALPPARAAQILQLFDAPQPSGTFAAMSQTAAQGFGGFAAAQPPQQAAGGGASFAVPLGGPSLGGGTSMANWRANLNSSAPPASQQQAAAAPAAAAGWGSFV